MAEPTVTNIFGASAIQDAASVTLTKADYPSLTAKADNTGESIFTAVFLEASKFLTPAAQSADPDIQITINPTAQEDLTRNGNSFVRHSYTVTFDMPNLAQTVKADGF